MKSYQSRNAIASAGEAKSALPSLRIMRGNPDSCSRCDRVAILTNRLCYGCRVDLEFLPIYWKEVAQSFVGRPRHVIKDLVRQKAVRDGEELYIYNGVTYYLSAEAKQRARRGRNQCGWGRFEAEAAPVAGDAGCSDKPSEPSEVAPLVFRQRAVAARPRCYSM